MDTCMYSQTEALSTANRQEFNLSKPLSDLLRQSSARHDHLCPRQVLGVRMGLAGLAAIGLPAPTPQKAALVIIETDGCFADGIEVATGATVGHRTLRVKDYGKTAATFVHVGTGEAVRLAPRPGVRELAFRYVPGILENYAAQLNGYQAMPESELFSFEEVLLTSTLEAILSQPGLRVTCDRCGEEIINARQVEVGGEILCTTCAGVGYYRKKAFPEQLSSDPACASHIH